MQTIGEQLEEARKRKGISIREAAEATKIRGDYLQKFESNQFDFDLPEIYARGFLRAYAVFLKLPGDRIMADYRALGLGEARPRTPSREIYGRMDLSIASAGENAPASTPVGETAEADAGAGARPRQFARIGTSLPETSVLNPRLVMRIALIVCGLVAAFLLVWGLVSLVSGGRTKTAAPAAATAPAAEPTATLIALDTVTVHVQQKNPDGSAGATVLPDTTLLRGESRAVPRRTALFVYTNAGAGKNLLIEINGKRYPLPAGYDSGELPAPRAAGGGIDLP